MIFSFQFVYVLKYQKIILSFGEYCSLNIKESDFCGTRSSLFHGHSFSHKFTQ